MLHTAPASYGFRMGHAPPIERRDPVSPVLRLGRFLAGARRERRSGTIEVRVAGRAHLVTLAAGVITDVRLAEPDPGGKVSERLALHRRSERLFVFERPHVLWSPGRESSRFQRCPSATW